jgi:hypothetical protein
LPIDSTENVRRDLAITAPPMRQTTVATNVWEECAVLSRAAIVYGLKELARRAGVAEEFFNSWTIGFDEAGFLTVAVGAGTRKQFRFPRASAKFWSDLQVGIFRTSTAGWLNGPAELAAPVPDFKIPFSSSYENYVGALFSRVNEDCLDCSVDLLTSIVLTLARFEETFPGPRDEHGRFGAFVGIAWRNNFLHRPIVDEYGLAFAEALSALLPGWQPQRGRLEVSLGHDVDEIGIPFSFRSTMGHTLRRGHPIATVRDLAARCTGTDTTYQRQLRRLVQDALARGLHPAIYWKASGPGPHDAGYDPRDRPIQQLISSFRSAGLEMGMHLSYETFQSVERFQMEVSALRDLLGEQKLGGRQDYLRWSPRCWIQWDSLDLAYDASVGFADQIGFRAGTCYPFRPWLLSENRQARLIEIPLLATDSALFGYLKLSPEQALKHLLDLLARCKAVGGVFALVWHNTTMLHSARAATYRNLLEALKGCAGYDWRSSGDGSYWI